MDLLLDDILDRVHDDGNNNFISLVESWAVMKGIIQDVIEVIKAFVTDSFV